MTWESLWKPPTLHPWVDGHEKKDIWLQCVHGCGSTGEGEPSEEKQMFILFCCLKLIHRFTLDGQDCLRGWEGRQYCPRSCWRTMAENTDSENDTDGGVVARVCEQDGVGGADVRNCMPLLDPAFCLPLLLSQQPPGRLWGPYPGPLPAESSQSSLFTGRSVGSLRCWTILQLRYQHWYASEDKVLTLWQRAVAHVLQNTREKRVLQEPVLQSPPQETVHFQVAWACWRCIYVNDGTQPERARLQAAKAHSAHHSALSPLFAWERQASWVLLQLLPVVCTWPWGMHSSACVLICHLEEMALTCPLEGWFTSLSVSKNEIGGY